MQEQVAGAKSGQVGNCLIPRDRPPSSVGLWGVRQEFSEPHLETPAGTEHGMQSRGCGLIPRLGKHSCPWMFR